MLTIEDKPTIKHAIRRRLDQPGKVQVVDIGIAEDKDCIRVGLWIILTDTINTDSLVDLQSEFHLPPSFDIKHLHNEIDEVAEACKKARAEIGVSHLIWTPKKDQEGRMPVLGTGLRGRWPS